MNNVITVREYALRMLHTALQDDPFTQAVMLAGGGELNALAERILELYHHEDVTSLSEDQCSYWEELMGITDTSTELTVRRSVIQAHWMASQPPTLEGIQAVANAWANGEITVSYSAEEQTITMTFSSARGIPEGEQQLRSAIGQIVPAHLAVVYGYLYLLCSEVNGMKCSAVNNTALTMFAGRGY